MFLDASEARNTARFPTSSGVCSRPRGMRSSTVRSNSSLGDSPSVFWGRELRRRDIFSHMGVQSRPGQMALTLTLKGARSTA